VRSASSSSSLRAFATPPPRTTTAQMAATPTLLSRAARTTAPRHCRRCLHLYARQSREARTFASTSSYVYPPPSGASGTREKWRAATTPSHHAARRLLSSDSSPPPPAGKGKEPLPADTNPIVNNANRSLATLRYRTEAELYAISDRRRRTILSNPDTARRLVASMKGLGDGAKKDVTVIDLYAGEGYLSQALLDLPNVKQVIAVEHVPAYTKSLEVSETFLPSSRSRRSVVVASLTPTPTRIPPRKWSTSIPAGCTTSHSTPSGGTPTASSARESSSRVSRRNLGMKVSPDPPFLNRLVRPRLRR